VPAIFSSVGRQRGTVAVESDYTQLEDRAVAPPNERHLARRNVQRLVFISFSSAAFASPSLAAARTRRLEHRPAVTQQLDAVDRRHVPPFGVSLTVTTTA